MSLQETFVDARAQKLFNLMTYASKIFYLHGHNDINNGQISHRRDENSFWIRRAFLGWEETKLDHYILVDMDGKRIEGEGDIPAEWPLHTQIYQNRPDVNCIIHSHPPYAMVFSATDLDLRPITHDATPIMNTKRFTLSTNTVTNKKMGDHVAAALENANTLLLKNHGIVAVGKSVQETVCWAVVLENACRMQLLAESTGVPYQWSDPGEAKVKSKIIFGSTAIREYWAYWCRMVDRNLTTEDDKNGR